MTFADEVAAGGRVVDKFRAAVLADGPIVADRVSLIRCIEPIVDMSRIHVVQATALDARA